MNCEIKSKSCSNIIVPAVNKLNRNYLNKIKEECRDNSHEDTYKKVLKSLELLVEGQQITKKDLQLGLVILSKQNNILLDLNQKLDQELKIKLSELNRIKKEQKERSTRQGKCSKRQGLPKRDPINSEIYKLLIKESEGATYIATRTRIAICLLTVTGIRIGELLSLKVGQLKTLLEEGWISIDRLKKGPSNHKAFLTSKGKKIIKNRNRDFEFLFLMKNNDSYVFTSDRKPNQMLGRQTMTMDLNKVMHSVSNLFPLKPNITSHSFRIGYISQLWKDPKDIEFVRQTLRCRSLNSSSN